MIGLMNYISEIFNTLLSYRIDYNVVGGEYFREWKNTSGDICGLIFVIILTPIFLQAYKSAANRFKRLYPNEKIIHIVKNNIIIVFLIPFLLGTYIGRFILPFICFENLYFIKGWLKDATLSNLWLDFLIVSFLILFVCMRFNIIYILSNKKVTLISASNLFKQIIKTKDIYYSSIKNVSFDNILFFEWLNIKLKNNKDFKGIVAFSNLKKVKEIIEKQIKKEIIND